jgi:hypothetical protein
MVETLSSGPSIVLLIGSHTNFATFLMTNPELKKNVEHVFIMAGGVQLENPNHLQNHEGPWSCYRHYWVEQTAEKKNKKNPTQWIHTWQIRCKLTKCDDNSQKEAQNHSAERGIDLVDFFWTDGTLILIKTPEWMNQTCGRRWMLILHIL